MVTLSVVVPATDQPPTLERCRSAIDSSRARPDQVLVVTTRGLTACEARNRGVALADGEVIVFVDADVEIHADAFDRIRTLFDADPGLTAVHGSYDDAPGDTSVVSTFRNLLHHHVHQEGAGPAETFWTGLGAVRRDAFLAAGGFDEERYPHPSIEDIELGGRLVAAGGRLLLDPTIQGKHLKRWTLRSMLHTDLVRRGIPWVALQVQNRKLANTLNCGWRHRLSAVAVAVLALSALLVQPVAAAGAGAALLLANQRFYALLARRQGPIQAVAGVGLHVLHHLVALVAIPAGLAAAVLAARPATDPLGSAIGAPEGMSQ